MATAGTCKICGRDAEHVGDQFIPAWTCLRCGSCDYDATIGWLPVETLEHRRNLSAWVREQNASGIRYPRITQEISRSQARASIPGLRERANRILRLISIKYPSLDSVTSFSILTKDPEIQVMSYSIDEQETMRLIRVLVDDEFLDAPKNNSTNQATAARLNVKGMLAAEALGRSSSASLQGFVAMWFHDSLNDAWARGFDPAIRAAGFVPLRIDNKEYVGGISDEIMAEIRRSRFIVADYTGQVNGVYFEAGFALGLGLTVIPTCRSDEIGKLHFDIRHINTLTWSQPADLAERLSKRIMAVVGAGPKAER